MAAENAVIMLRQAHMFILTVSDAEITFELDDEEEAMELADEAIDLIENLSDNIGNIGYFFENATTEEL